MADAEIHYKLDLIVRLVDTTTGKKVGQKQIIFKSENQMLVFQRRDEGVYVLLNHGREDMTLEICAEGYLPMRKKICYEELSPKFPEVEVPLIPEAGRNRFVDYLTLEGNRPGITSVAAVSLKKPHGVVISYNARRQSLKLYYAKAFEEQTYAVIHEEAQEFEEFQIGKRLDKLELKLVSPLNADCRPEEKINRIVHGKVDPDGHYILRVLDEGCGTDYLVRYEVNGQVSFKRFSTENQNSVSESE